MKRFISHLHSSATLARCSRASARDRSGRLHDHLPGLRPETKVPDSWVLGDPRRWRRNGTLSAGRLVRASSAGRRKCVLLSRLRPPERAGLVHCIPQPFHATALCAGRHLFANNSRYHYASETNERGGRCSSGGLVADARRLLMALARPREAAVLCGLLPGRALAVPVGGGRWGLYGGGGDRGSSGGLRVPESGRSER